MFNYIEKLNSIEQFKVLKEENEKIVFVFSATWCPDCIMLDRYLEETMNKFPEIKFIYVNRDDYPEIAQALDIFGIPSFVGYKNNVEVSRFVSRLAKTQKEVEEFLKKNSEWESENNHREELFEKLSAKKKESFFCSNVRV